MKKTIMAAMLLCAATLAQAQSRLAYIHMKSGEVMELEYNDVDSITFGPSVNLDQELQATYIYNIYYGGTSYMLHMSDAPISSQGLPTQAGQTVVRVYLFANQSADSNNALLTAGRYPISDEIAVGNIYNASEAYTSYIKCTGLNDEGNPDGYQVGYTNGSLNVSYEADGTANVVFRGELVDYGEEGEALGIPHHIKVSYTGQLPFDNQDPASYVLLGEDVKMEPNGLSGGYSNVDGRYGSYTLTYYNCELDKDGFIVGPGELMNFEILTEEASPMDISKLAGEYTISSALEGPWAPGQFLSGEMYDYYGMTFPIGTYYTVYGEGGAETRLKAFSRDGSVKFSVDGDNVTIDADLTVEGGHKITLNYTASASSIADMSSSRSKAAKKSLVGQLTPAGKKSIFDHQSVIKLVKKN